MTDVLECADCGRRSFYSKRRCLDCGSDDLVDAPAGDGELLATTTVHVTPEGVREPNALGLAAFSGGANVVAQLADAAAVGDTVRLSGERDLRTTDDGVLRGCRLVPGE